MASKKTANEKSAQKATIQTKLNFAVIRKRSALDENKVEAGPSSKRPRAPSSNHGERSEDPDVPVSSSQASTGTLMSQEAGIPNGSIEEKMRIAREILKETFGYDNFKSKEQENVIQTLLAGENALVILPTNAGKSLCYQLPAICFAKLDEMCNTNPAGNHGITLVISPLLALMTDQVESLRRRGVEAYAINSNNSPAENDRILNSLVEGRVQILFCTPERFKNRRFVQGISAIPGGVRLLAVDEAHCIYEWGYGFRTDYLKLPRIAKEINAQRVVCLTATANDEIANDMAKSFEIANTNIYRSSLYRYNLRLERTIVAGEDHKLKLVVDFLEDNAEVPGQTVIYVHTIQTTKSLVTDLRNHFKDELTIDGYNSKTLTSRRSDIEASFMRGDIDVLITTSAYGMGINKPDIRRVVHYDAARSLEEYSQQIGRAGRDGEPSKCLLLFDPEDIGLYRRLVKVHFPNEFIIRRCLKLIFDSATNSNVGVGEPFEVNFSTVQIEKLDKGLNILFAVCQKKLGLFEKLRKIKNSETSSSSPDPENIVEFILKKAVPSPEQIQQLSQELQRELGMKGPLALQPLESLDSLFRGEKCYAVGLVEYFSTTLPDGMEQCNQCTACSTPNGSNRFGPPAP